MGMAASQARFIALTARRNDIEYQGQQINQQRTTLSSQVTDLYNSLLAMDVPTPPSVKDYQTTTYAGTSGAVKYSFQANDVKPQENGKYTVTLSRDSYEDSLTQNSGSKSATYKALKAVSVTTTDFLETNGGLTKYYVKLSDGTYRPSNKSDFTYSAEDKCYHVNDDITLVSFTKVGEGETGDFETYTIGGYPAYEATKIKEFIGEDIDYATAIANANIKGSDGRTLTIEDFFCYFDQNGNVHFATKESVKNGYDKDYACKTYDFSSTGKVVKREEKKDCEINFDASSGRITDIDVPNDFDQQGNPISWVNITLSVSTETDQEAYDDAMNQYTYKKELYDREQEEINAKTSVIQQQDKNLELKLTRLDNERKAVDTEYEAVKKVVENNIDKSFKTFG